MASKKHQQKETFFEDAEKIFSISDIFLQYVKNQNTTVADECFERETHLPQSDKIYNRPCCYRCSRRIRLTKGDIIQKGMHLLWGRIFSIRGKSPYYHHAIVTEINWQTGDKANLKVVEFIPTGFGLSLSVIENIREIDFENENVFYKKYTNNRYTDDQIVARARVCVGNNNYDLLQNNCENMALWCVSGENISFQVEDKKNKLYNFLSQLAAFVGKIDHFLNKSQLSYWGKTHVIKIGYHVIGIFIFSIVVLAIQLIITVFNLIKLSNHKKSGFSCASCFKSEKIKLISKICFSFIAITSISIIHPLSTKVFCFVGVLTSLIGVQCVPIAISNIHRKFKSKLDPFYGLPRIPVSSLEMLVPGVVLAFPKNHAGILKSVKVLNLSHSKEPKILNLRLIYTNCIDYENVEFNLHDDCILQVMNYMSLDVHSKDDVLKKAETLKSSPCKCFSKEDIFKCKFLNYDEEDVRTLKFTKVESVWSVHIGDIIRFKFSKHISNWFTGVVIEKTIVPDIFVNLEYFHIGKDNRFCCDKATFALHKRELRIHCFSTKQYHSRQTTLRMAEEHLGKTSSAWFYKSNSFVKKIITRSKRGDILKSGHDIKRGMAIKIGKPFVRNCLDVTEIRYFIGDKKQFMTEGFSIITTIYQTSNTQALVRAIKYYPISKKILEQDETLNIHKEQIYSDFFSDNEQDEDQIVEYARSLKCACNYKENNCITPILKSSNETDYPSQNEKPLIKHNSNNTELFKSIKSVFAKSFGKNSKQLSKCNEIKRGDILILPTNYKIVVKCAEMDPSGEKYITDIELNIVHVAWPGVCKSRKVRTEKFSFNLKKDYLHVFNFPKEDIEPDEKTIEKAKKEVTNSRSYNFFTKQSGDMSRRCKLRKGSGKHETVLRVRSSAEVKAADMISFKYCRMPHKGIVIEKPDRKEFEEIVKLEYFHLPSKDNRLRSNSGTFNLNTVRVFSCGDLGDLNNTNYLLHEMDKLTGREMLVAE